MSVICGHTLFFVAFSLFILISLEDSLFLCAEIEDRRMIQQIQQATKRFIAPGGWFSMNYPQAWSEFEDGEGSFLFYNPEVWNGNFRISAFRGNSAYAEANRQNELCQQPGAKLVSVGPWHCAYSQEEFQEEEHDYTTHWWVTGEGDLAIECSFTVLRGESIAPAQEVLASVEIRDLQKKYPAEVIPVRLSEIWQIDEAYAFIEHEVKNRFSLDFQGLEEDLPNLQRLIDEAGWSKKKRDSWIALGIALCVILTNELDGYEWRTLVDGNREAPLLVHPESGVEIDPLKLVWSKVKAGQSVDMEQTLNSLTC